MENTGSVSCPFCEWYYKLKDTDEYYKPGWQKRSLLCTKHFMTAILAAVAATISIRSTIAPSVAPNWKAAQAPDLTANPYPYQK